MQLCGTVIAYTPRALPSGAKRGDLKKRRGPALVKSPQGIYRHRESCGAGCGDLNSRRVLCFSCSRGISISQPVQGTAHCIRSLVHDVRVNLSRLDILVPEQFLHSADVIAILQKMRGKRVA